MTQKNCSTFLVVIFLWLSFPTSAFSANHYYCGPDTDHFDGYQFYNANNSQRHTFLDMLRWKITSFHKKWPHHVKHKFDVPPAQVENSNLRLSFVGHSTWLIQTHGVNILTDPIWSEHASPITWLGDKRVTAPGIKWDDLPKIDIVLITHNHYDHLDLPTIQHLWKRDQPQIITPLGNDTIIHNYDPSIKVNTLDWHHTLAFNDEMTIHMEPSQHWSARSLWDRDNALWSSYVIETPSGKIYFAGDSGYDNGENFRKIRQKHGEFRLAFLPISPYRPEWFMEYDHLNPEEAVRAHYDLGAPPTLAMHYGAFHLGDVGYWEPVKELRKAQQKYQVPEKDFRALKIGEAVMIP